MATTSIRAIMIKATNPLVAESWSEWNRFGPQLIKSCGSQNYCCQTKGQRTSCCDEGKYFILDKVDSHQVIIPFSASSSSPAAFSSSVELISTFGLQLSSPPSSSLSLLFTTSTYTESTSELTTAGPDPSTPDHPAQTGPILNVTAPTDAPINNPVNKGLAAGWGITLCLTAIIGTAYGLYRYKRWRRQIAKRSQATGFQTADIIPDPLPTHPIETNGYTSWEMATNRNAHEAPIDNPTRPGSRHTRSSRLGF